MGEHGLAGRFAQTFWVWTNLYIVFGLVLMDWILDASVGILVLTSLFTLIAAEFERLIEVRRPSQRGTDWPIGEVDEPTGVES